MAIDARKRARQLARKAAKRKAQVAAKRKHDAVGSGSGQLAHVSGFPLHQCYMPEALFRTGIGNVVISRKAGDTVYAGVFLVDVYCLGVKDAYLAVHSQGEFASFINRFSELGALSPTQPACARKLVEEAVAYAGDLGVAPYKDYRKAQVVFGNIDPGACPQSFVFGKDGKPLFVSGPHDSKARCNLIMAKLRKRCGPDGFHFMIGMGQGDWGEDEYEIEDVEVDETEEDSESFDA